MSPGEVTQLLWAWRDGDEEALQKLAPLVYDELKRLAHRYMLREGAGHTLQTTAVVHDAYIRLAHSTPIDWQDRTHFYALCAQLMRRVLVDYERSRATLKRGGALQRVSLDDAPQIGRDGQVDLLVLDEALTRLQSFDKRKARVVELRFFGGLTVQETAQVLGTSPDSVMRDWKIARSWLMRELDLEKVRGSGTLAAD